MKRNMDGDEQIVLNSFNKGKSIINEYTPERYIINEIDIIIQKAEEYIKQIHDIINLNEIDFIKEKCDEFEGDINDLIDQTNDVIEQIHDKQAAYILSSQNINLDHLITYAENIKIYLGNCSQYVEELFSSIHGSNSFGNINLNQILKDIKFLKK